MKILFITRSGHAEERDMPQVPSIGEHVALFYDPKPVVSDVIWCAEVDNVKYDAVVALD